jgi:hypothetical protein
MKLLHVTFRFEFLQDVQDILDGHDVAAYVRLPMAQGADVDGRHFGSKVFPGHVSLLQATVDDEDVDALLDDIEAFRTARDAHNHLQALVVPVERRLGPDR